MKDIPIYCIHMYMSSLQKITMSNFGAQTGALQGHVLTLSDATLMRDRDILFQFTWTYKQN